MQMLSINHWVLIPVLLIAPFFWAAITYGQPPNPEMSDTEQMLNVMAENFKNKIDEEFSLIVQFDIKDEGTSWHVVVEKGRKVTVGKGSHHEAQFFFSTTTDALRLIYEGKMTAMTAGGKATGSDTAPLEFGWAEDLEFTPEVKIQVYTFLQHFFNPWVPEKVLLGEKHSRFLHGGHVVVLYYQPGFRSAWYMVKKGERLNEPGDTNPFPQAFIFIEGEGFAKIGDETVKVKAGESYYVPPNSDHVVWTESDEPLVLIWLAWGEGA